MINFDDYFGGLTREEYEEETRKHVEWLTNNASKNKVTVKEWHYLTDDCDSYPEVFEYVLVEDDIGDKNVACCYPDYDWYISNGEDSLKLVREVIKWAYI